MQNERQSHRRLARILAAIGVSAGLLWWAFSQVDVKVMLGILGRANPGWTLAAYVVLLGSSVVHCRRWSMLLSVFGYSHTFSSVLKIHFAGLLCNALLPAQTGLDAARIQFARDITGRRLSMVGLILLDRLIGVLAVSALGCLAWFFVARIGVPASMAIPSLAMFIVSLSILVLAAILRPPMIHRLLCRIPPLNKKGRMNKKGRKDRDYVQLAEALQDRLPSIFAPILAAVFQWLLVSLALGMMCHALHLPASAFSIGVLAPLIAIVTMTVPISINGLGVREAMFCLLTIPMGFDKNQAVSLATAWFAVILLQTVPGAVAMIKLSRSKQ